MYINFKELQAKCNSLGRPITGILQLGAYDGAEHFVYDVLDIPHVVWVEPNPLLFERLIKNVPPANCVQAACGSYVGKAPFYLAYSDDRTNLGCSSLLKLGKHAEIYPWIKEIDTIEVEVTTIDNIMEQYKYLPINVLSMDVQGSELDCLKGASQSLVKFDVIIAEYSKTPLYVGACSFAELDTFLKDAGFGYYTHVPATDIWGDICYLRGGNPHTPV